MDDKERTCTPKIKQDRWIPPTEGDHSYGKSIINDLSDGDEVKVVEGLSFTR